MKFQCITALLLAAGTNVWAADIENGQQLHTACVQCHGTEVYTRENRRVTDLDKLENQVQRCALTLGKAWGVEDVEDVTAYINPQHYKFGDCGSSKAALYMDRADLPSNLS